MNREFLQIGLRFLALLLGTTLPCFPQTPSPVNPYNAELAALQRRWQKSDAAQQVVLLDQAMGLREYVDDPAAVRRFVDMAARDKAVNRLVRDQAIYEQSILDLHAGDLDRRTAKLSELGFVRGWAVVGRFKAASEMSLGPEQGFNATHRYDDGSGQQRAWRVAPQTGPTGWLDLARLHPRAGSEAVVFASTSVYANGVRAVALRFGADSPLSVYVNGRQIFATDADGRFAFDQYAVGAHLEPGWNTITLKLRRGSPGAWRFALRITAAAGGGLNLMTSADQAATATASANTVAVSDLVAEAAQAVAAHPGSAEALETLGLLERVRGRTGELDHMEQAARLSPSVGRWLHVADACAEATCVFSALNAAAASEPGNPRVKSRLADYYFARGQRLKARDLLREAAAALPSDFVVRERLADLYVSAGLNSQAFAEYRKLEAEFPAPLWLRRELAGRYEDMGLIDRAAALGETLIAQDAASEPVRAALVRIYRRRGDAAKLRALYAGALKMDPQNVDALARLGELEAAQADYARAETELRGALAIAPDDDSLHQQLADILEFAGQRRGSEAELGRAVAENPGDADLRRRLASQTGTTAADPDSAYLVNAGAMAAEARRQPPRDASTAIELADIRVEHVAANGLSSARVQQVVYVANEQAARTYATRSIQYANGTQRLNVIAARAYKSDGRVVEAEYVADDAVADAGASMYYDARSHVLRFPGLEKGDVVELDYRLSPETNTNPYGDYFGELVTFGSSLPRRLQRYVLITPAATRYHVLQVRMPRLAEVRLNGTERIYTWEARNLSPWGDEPRGPALTEIAPYVHVSTFSTWQQVGRWYAQLIAPQFTLDAALRELAARLVADKNNDQEKIAAIHQFVLRNTHYVALEFGVYGYKPYPVSQVYARRFGDCKDKASLMIALLRAAGIEADIALVRTRRLGEVGEQATSISIFNHAVVYVPKHDLWLDGTAEYAGSRELPLDDQGAMALTVASNGDARLRRIPVTLPMENYTHRQVQARIAPDGKIEFTGSAYTRGEDAPGLRREFEVRERQRDSFRNRLAEVLPTVRVEQVQVDGATDLERDVVVTFRGELESFVGRRSLVLSPTWMHRSYVQTLAALSTRTQDLVLPAPWTTEEELHFTLPEGARLEGVPLDRTLDTAFGTAVFRYQRQGNELVVTTSVQFRKLRITAAEYGQFRNFCTQVESAFRSDIKVVL